MRLKGKNAVVTAAAQGIGKAIVEEFLKEGAEVHAVDINGEGLATLPDAVKRYAIDVTNPQNVTQLSQQLPEIDILVNGVGFVHHGDILNCEEESWDHSFNLNVKSMYRMIRAFLPGMLERSSGSIVNISSVASSIKGVPHRCVYSATKAAIIGLTKSIAVDFVGKGIRSNAICPGTVATPSLEERIAAQGAEAREAFEKRQPLGRLGHPREIAALAVYLSSDEAAFTTGAVYVIDGGWTA